MAEKIKMGNGHLEVTDNPIIPYIEGDGVVVIFGKMLKPSSIRL